MATRINTLTEYVYKTFIEQEVKEITINGDNEVILDRIKSIDKLPCKVFVGVGWRVYYLKIKSEDLIEPDTDFKDKLYYNNVILPYDATKNYHDEMDKKEAGSSEKCRLKIIKKEDVDKFMDLVINTLKELKFNTFNGILLKNDISQDMFDCLKCPTIEIEEGEECCVCYERTLNKTWCKHSICFRCMENISTYYQEEHDGLITKDCPICRKNIIFRDNDDED